MSSLARNAPRTKAARRERILGLIVAGAVRSQMELTDLLIKEGFLVTQATVSRDLEELGATKIRDEGGALIYGITQSQPAGEDSISRVTRVAQDLLVSAEASANLVVLRTPPGGAHLLASALDQAISNSALPQLLGTVAGDDTVLVITRDATGGEAAASHILLLAEGSAKSAPEVTEKKLKSQENQDEGKRS